MERRLPRASKPNRIFVVNSKPSPSLAVRMAAPSHRGQFLVYFTHTYTLPFPLTLSSLAVLLALPSCLPDPLLDKNLANKGHKDMVEGRGGGRCKQGFLGKAVLEPRQLCPSLVPELSPARQQESSVTFGINAPVLNDHSDQRFPAGFKKKKKKKSDFLPISSVRANRKLGPCNFSKRFFSLSFILLAPSPLP